MAKLQTHDRGFWTSAKMNNSTFLQYYNRLTDLMISQFEWINLPPTCDARFLELVLFADGMAVFFKDEILGYLTLQTMIGGPLDVYRIPIIRRAYASNGYNMELDNLNSVLIFNNSLHINSLLDIEMYALRLYEIQRAIDINVKNQKTPKIVCCDENERLTIVNLFKKYEGNEPFIYGQKGLNARLDMVDVSSPYVADKLQVLKQLIWDEAMSYIGVANTNTSKRERLNTAEVASGMGDVEAQRFTRLAERQRACDKINAMFGLNVSVRYRQVLPNIEEQMVTDITGEEGEGGEDE